MKPTDVLLAVTVAVTWGLAFIATEYALYSFTPAQLVGFRFVIAALPVFFIKKPDIPWRLLIALGLFLFTGQFMFLFFSYKAGMPPGLASVATHTQALFTIIIAALVLREVPTPKQISAVAIAFMISLIFTIVICTTSHRRRYDHYQSQPGCKVVCFGIATIVCIVDIAVVSIIFAITVMTVIVTIIIVIISIFYFIIVIIHHSRLNS